MSERFRPGDVIERTNVRGFVDRRYVVQAPAYTSRGKLRLRATTGSDRVMTTWWEGRDGWLPPRYRWVGP